MLFVSLSAFSGNPKASLRYDLLIRSLAVKHGISPSLIHAMIKNESNYNPHAVSSKGAKGLMQLMPETASDYGVDDPYDPRQNIEAGIKHIKNLLSVYDGKLNLALAAYNAGQEAVKKYKGIPPFPETQNYIKKINSTFKKSRINSQKSIYTYYNESGRLVITNIPHLKKTDLRSILRK
jgi:soluble lytic murein transglycosylase-like protein